VGVVEGKVPNGTRQAQEQHTRELVEPEKSQSANTAALLDLIQAGQLREVALELPQSLSVNDWQRIGHALGQVENAFTWWIGDWWAFGEHKYGDRKALLESEAWTGPSFGTCANAATVCRAFKTSCRHELLTFEHHRILASLPREQANSLLDWCEQPLRNGRKKSRSVRELRAEIRGQAAENPARNGDRLGAEEKPSAELRETRTHEAPGPEPLREPAAVTPENNLQPAESRPAALLRMLRDLRDYPVDAVAVAQLAIAADLTTLPAAQSFFRTFYQRLQERFAQPQPVSQP
jgi:hypothetical protein